MAPCSTFILNDKEIHSRGEKLIVPGNLIPGISEGVIVMVDRIDQLAAVGKDSDRAASRQSHELDAVGHFPAGIGPGESARNHQGIRNNIDLRKRLRRRCLRLMLCHVCYSALAAERVHGDHRVINELSDIALDVQNGVDRVLEIAGILQTDAIDHRPRSERMRSASEFVMLEWSQETRRGERFALVAPDDLVRGSRRILDTNGGCWEWNPHGILLTRR